MLTIQSFLLKVRSLCVGVNTKKNVKYAMLIFAYAFAAVFMVSKFDFIQIGSGQKTLEAFAAQDITNLNEETSVLDEVDYLSNALNNASSLEHKDLNKTQQWPVLTVGYKDDAFGITNSGQVNLISADTYSGDFLIEAIKEPKEQIVKKESDVSKKKKSAAKKETAKATEAMTMSTSTAMYSLSTKEVEILERIVEAEATGEDVKGKMLVANVILNRVNDSSFPDSVEAVVFQKSGSKYQFSPICDKRYYSVNVSKETKNAVQRVIQGEDYSQGALYFSARKRASAANMRWFDKNLKWLFQYGNHEFFTHK